MVGRSGTPDALDVLQRQNLRESVRRFQNSVGRTVVWLRQRRNAIMSLPHEISGKGDDIYKDRYKRVY
jgi:hypothetical protein